MKNRLTTSVLCAAAISLLFAASCAPVINSPLTASGFLGTPLSYRITATNDPTLFGADVPPPAGLTIDTNTGLISGTPTASGVFKQSIRASNNHGSDTKTLEITIGHPVLSEKELLIVDPNVVQNKDMVGVGKPWHFKSVLQRIAGQGVDVDKFAQAWFSLWDSEQTVGSSNQFKVPPEKLAGDALRDAWANDKFKLLAIVNRIDLTAFKDHDETKGVDHLGEGRFVYEVEGKQFTIILEFHLPVRSGETPDQALLRWAKSWHALGDSGLSQGQYASAIQEITREYSDHGNLSQIRTNHIFSSLPWNLREFHFRDGPTPQLIQATTAQAPDVSHLKSAQMGDFIRANEPKILDGTYVLSPELLGGMSKENDKVDPPNVNDKARFVVSFNTCIGCHTNLESDVQSFQHIKTFQLARPAFRSNFLIGKITPKGGNQLPGDPTNTHEEMAIRIKLLSHYAHDEIISKDFTILKSDNERLRQSIKARASRVH